MHERGRPDHDPARRNLLRQSLALAGIAALAPPAGSASASSAPAPGASSDPHPALGRTLKRIAFGSCAEVDKPQPVWDPVLARKNDLFIFLGDNIYGDTRDMSVLSAKYAKFAAIPGVARLRATTPVVAMWDDHDFGENDAGGDYPMKEQSREVFLDFWQEPADSPRRKRDGVYASYVFGPPGQRVQVILPDLRYNRTALTPRELGGTRLQDLGAGPRGIRPAAAGPVCAQSRPEGDDARRTAVAMARAPARSAGGASPLRLERAGACRLHRLGILGQLRARPAASLRPDPAQARERRRLPERRHSLRGIVEARRQRPVHALGPDLERPDRGMARADAQCKSRKRGRGRRELRLLSTSTGRARPQSSRWASSIPPAGRE